MREIISIIFLIFGAVLMLISALGVVRMPDLYLRMSASTKSATLGAGTVLVAAAVYFNELGPTSEAIVIIFFLLLTAPVAAHMMGRAAYFNGVPLWEGTRYDELKGRYNAETQTLAGLNEPARPNPKAEKSKRASAP